MSPTAMIFSLIGLVLIGTLPGLFWFMTQFKKEKNQQTQAQDQEPPQEG